MKNTEYKIYESMDYIKSFTEKDLCKIILETKETLYICLPLLQPEVLKAINEIHSNLTGNATVHVGIDFSPESFRQGYGEIESYKNVVNNDIDIFHLKDNRISFIITDDKGYFLFFESRYFIPAEKPTFNAVSIDPISIIRLKQHFFQSFNSKSDYANEIANSFIEESERLKNIAVEFNNPPIITPKEINSELCKSVVNNLVENPPLKPEYKRIVEYYSNKLQYVRLEFNGANLIAKKIELPADALPLNDEEFKKRLESKLNLFDKGKSNEAFKFFNEFNIKVQKFRDEYLTALKTRKENILLKSKKVEFLTKLEVLKKELSVVKTKSLEKISEQITNTKKSLLNQLIDFYKHNIEAVSSSDLFANSSPEYKLKRAEELAADIINRIKWPVPDLILSDSKFNVQFSDITFEDLQNAELVNELVLKQLILGNDITNLADIGKAIELKD